MKQKIQDLAIFGGTPAFAEALHVGRPNIGDRTAFLTRVHDLLDRRWLTNNGPYVLEFEKRICDYLGTKHAIAVCNATIALEIAIRALGLKGEVIIPSFTFIATAHALQWLGISPVFCDVDPETHNIDPRKIEELITPETSGIMGVHVWGRPCEIDDLTYLSRKHHLALMFDAAHAFGSSYCGRMIGNFGDLEVFSFHATKFFNTFEGGAIVTNNSQLAGKIHMMVNFGFGDQDRTIYLGTNGKMSEISAAMGITNLESLDEFIQVNQRNYLKYREGLAGLAGVKMVMYDENEKGNFQYVVLELDPEIAKVNRDQMVDILRAENVLARRYFSPGCHEMEPYYTYYPDAGRSLPETQKLTRRVMTLPTGTSVSEEDIQKICQIIGWVVKNGEEISLLL